MVDECSNLRNRFIFSSLKLKENCRKGDNIKPADRKSVKCHSSGQDKFMTAVGACTESVYINESVIKSSRDGVGTQGSQPLTAELFATDRFRKRGYHCLQGLQW